MRLLISCDMEGVSGIVDWEQVTPGKNEWQRGRKLMVGDVNAAINGAFTGGATAVTVSDAHWHARSLEIEALDPRAALHSGSPSPFSMLQGIDDADSDVGVGYDALVCIGYHAMAGAKKAVLCHTWSENVRALWLNETLVGEIGLNAAVAGHYGTPLIALSGDRAACREAQDLLGTGVEVAVVKQGTGRFAAECLPLPVARQKICEAVAAAVARHKRGEGPAPYRVPTPVRLSVEFKFPHQADRAFLMPGVTRLSGVKLDYVADDVVMALRAFRAMTMLAGE